MGGFMKAGLAGEETPKCNFPSYVGRQKYSVGGSGADVLIGKQAEEERGLLALKYPMEHGVVKHWDDMERIWRYIYRDTKWHYEEHAVLLSEAPLNPRTNRER